MRNHRKGVVRLALTAVVTALAGVAVGCGADESSNGGNATARGDNSKPLKVGLIAPYSGVFGFYGETLENVLKGRFAAPDGKGIQIQVITGDDQSDPKTALTKARKFVQEDRVDAVVCCVNGAATLAVAPYLSSMKVPQIAPLPGPAGLQKFETAFSVGFAPAQLTEPFGRYAVEKLGHKTAAILSSDFVQGHLVSEGFKKGFTAAGGKIVGEQYPPLDTADYGAFLSKLPKTDVVFGFVAGADAVRMIKQFDAAGLKDRTQLTVLGPGVSRLILDQIGAPAVGVEAIFHYAEDDVDTAANKQFQAAIAGKAPERVSPNFVQANAFATGSALLAALRQSPGARKADLVAALEKVQFEAPWGPFSFDPETHYPVIDGFYYEVVKGTQRLQHEVLGIVEGQPEEPAA